MTHPDLVALLTTDEATVRHEKLPWRMLLPALERRLNQQTAHRVLRSDVDAPANPAHESDSHWQEFLARRRVTPLYMECDVT